jgi:hypothetical protein
MSQAIDSTLRYMHQEYSVVHQMTENVSDEHVLKLSDTQINEFFTHITTLKNLKSWVEKKVKHLPKESVAKILDKMSKMDISLIENRVKEIAARRDALLGKIEKTTKRILKPNNLLRLGNNPTLEEKLTFVRKLSKLSREDVIKMIASFSNDGVER